MRGTKMHTRAHTHTRVYMHVHSHHRVQESLQLSFHKITAFRVRSFFCSLQLIVCIHSRYSQLYIPTNSDIHFLDGALTSNLFGLMNVPNSKCFFSSFSSSSSSFSFPPSNIFFSFILCVFY